MVLRIGFAALLMCISGCLTPRPLTQLPNNAPVAVRYVLHDSGSKMTAAPSGLAEALDAALRARNFEPRRLEVSTPALTGSTAKKLQRMASEATGSHLLLVEMNATYNTQMNGLFRWTVSGRLSLSGPGPEGVLLQREFTTAAFVRFAFQKEEAAILAAKGQVEVELHGLVSEFLSDTTSTTTATATTTAARTGADDLIYFVMVDRFENGDVGNDGAVNPADPAGWHGGDLAGVRQRLDWLQALGVKTLWLSPLYKSRQDKVGEHGAFHGYWVHDHNAMEPRFGDFTELRKLSDELHGRDMELMLDLVLNHVGYNAPLTDARPDWFHGFGDIKDWNNSVQMTQYDVHGLPDLAVERDDVYRYLLSHARTWVELANPDGFRLDAVKHVPAEFWSRFNREVRGFAPADFRLLAEDLSGKPASLVATLDAGFDALFDFPVAFALGDVFCKGRHLGQLASVLSLDRHYAHPEKLVTLLDNHDLPRISSVCGDDHSKVARALAGMFLVRGVPSLLWGTEVGLTGAKEPANRADMRFEAAHPLAQRIAAMMALRRRHEALGLGRTRLLHLKDGLVLLRATDTDAVIVAIDVPASALKGLALSLGPVEFDDGGILVAGVKDLGLAKQLVDEGSFERPSEARMNWQVRLRAAPGMTDVRLVGSGPELGDWKPEQGVTLQREGASFVGEVSLHQGLVHAYKFVTRSGNEWTWESVSDRYVAAPHGQDHLRADHRFGQQETKWQG